MGNPKRTKGQKDKGQKDISTDIPIHLCALILELFWADRHISTGTCVYLYRHTLISHLPYSFFYLPTSNSLYLRYKKELRGYSPKLFRDFTCKSPPCRCIFAAVIMIRLRASAALGRAKTRFVLHSLARALRCLLKNKNCLTKKYHHGKSSYLLYISPHGNCWSQRYRSAATVQSQSAKNSIQKSICLLILDILNIFGKILV